MATLSKDVEADAEPISSLGMSLLSNESTGGVVNLVPSGHDERLQRDFVKQFPGRSVNEHQTSSVQSNISEIANREISDAKVPMEMKFEHYDILLLHTDEDIRLAEEVKYHLENHEQIVTKDGSKIRVLLYSELLAVFNQRFGCMEIGLEHCTYTFMLVTEAFSKCVQTRFMSEECLCKSLNDMSKRWCFVPVFIDKGVGLPFGLSSLFGINYNRQDEFYFATITKMMNDRHDLRLQREKDQKADIDEFKQEKFAQEKLEKSRRKEQRKAAQKSADSSSLAEIQQREQKDLIKDIDAQVKSSKLGLTQSSHVRGRPSENIDSSLAYEETSCRCTSNSATEPCETEDFQDDADIKAKQKEDFSSSSYILDQLQGRSGEGENTPHNSCQKKSPFNASSYIRENMDSAIETFPSSDKIPEESLPENSEPSDALFYDSACRPTDPSVQEVHHHHTYIIQHSNVQFGDKVSTSVVDSPSCEAPSNPQDFSHNNPQAQALPNNDEKVQNPALGLSSANKTDVKGEFIEPTQLQFEEETSSKTSGLCSFLSGMVPEANEPQIQACSKTPPNDTQEHKIASNEAREASTQSCALTAEVEEDDMSEIQQDGVSSTASSTLETPDVNQASNNNGSMISDKNLTNVAQLDPKALGTKGEVQADQLDSKQNKIVRDSNEMKIITPKTVRESTNQTSNLWTNYKTHPQRSNEGSSVDPEHLPRKHVHHKKKNGCTIC